MDANADEENFWVQLSLAVLPNLIASLIVALALYWFLRRKAIPGLVSMASDVAVKGTSLKSQMTNPGVEDFYQKFGQVPWIELIKSASNIDIVTWYFDSWIRNNRDDIRDFFQRGGTVRVVLPDPRVEQVLDLTKERYPELDREDARKKIANTGIKLYELAAESRSQTARVEVYLSDRTLSYSSIRFDSRSVLLSVFDQFRNRQVDSPAILLSLRPEALRSYWDKEIGGFFSMAKW